MRTRADSAPIFMMEPLPQLFSICAMARFNAFLRSSCCAAVAIHPPIVLTFEALATARNLRREVSHPIPEENTKRTTKTQARERTMKAFSTCLTRTEFPSISTPITSKR